MRIIWQDEAERDLDRIADYILKDDPAAALRLIYTIREATRVLGEHPNTGRTGHTPCRARTDSYACIRPQCY